jgi:hypothetical protein
MMGAWDFVADLTKAPKTYQEIKETADAAFDDQSLKKAVIYATIKKVKAGKSIADMPYLNPKKTVRTPDLIASVDTTIAKDCCLSMEMIPVAHEVSEKIIFNILHKDLGLEKNLARWVPKLLNNEQKRERVQGC